METLYRGDALLGILDISGYTRFMMGTDLAHAQAIINELMGVIKPKIETPLRIAKLEGDAVFFYGITREGSLDGAVSSTAGILPTIFTDFYERKKELKSGNMCMCNGCKSIGQLELKGVAHVGEIIVQRDKDDHQEELAGSSVIVLHRLLKNSIRTKPYFLVSDPAYSFFQRYFGTDLERRIENYGEEDIGKVDVRVHYPIIAGKEISDAPPWFFKRALQALKIDIVGLGYRFGKKKLHFTNLNVDSH